MSATLLPALQTRLHPARHEWAQRRLRFGRVVPGRRGGLLSSEEQLSLFHRWRKGGDKRRVARNRLGTRATHRQHCWSPAGERHVGSGCQAGARCGLLEAAHHFDPDRGFRFGTYAGWWILSAMGSYLTANREFSQGQRMKRKPKVAPWSFVSLDAAITPDGDSLAGIIPSDDAAPIRGKDRLFDADTSATSVSPRDGGQLSDLQCRNPR